MSAGDVTRQREQPASPSRPRLFSRRSGYARVSTKAHELEREIRALKAERCDEILQDAALLLRYRKPAAISMIGRVLCLSRATRSAPSILAIKFCACARDTAFEAPALANTGAMMSIQ